MKIFVQENVFDDKFVEENLKLWDIDYIAIKDTEKVIN